MEGDTRKFHVFEEFHSRSEHPVHLVAISNSSEYSALEIKMQVVADQMESLYYCTELCA